MTPVICPCCGSAISAPVPASELPMGRFGGVEAKVVRALADSFPRPIGIDELIDIVYGADPNGGPGDATNTIKVIISTLRSKLVLFGWTIPKSAGGNATRGVYRLERLKDEAA